MKPKMLTASDAIQLGAVVLTLICSAVTVAFGFGALRATVKGLRESMDRVERTATEAVRDLRGSVDQVGEEMRQTQVELGKELQHLARRVYVIERDGEITGSLRVSAPRRGPGET